MTYDEIKYYIDNFCKVLNITLDDLYSDTDQYYEA